MGLVMVELERLEARLLVPLVTPSCFYWCSLGSVLMLSFANELNRSLCDVLDCAKEHATD